MMHELDRSPARRALDRDWLNGDFDGNTALYSLLSRELDEVEERERREAARFRRRRKRILVAVAVVLIVVVIYFAR